MRHRRTLRWASLAQSRGKLFGTAYRSTFAIGDLCYREVALAEFDSLATEIGTMMNTIQPVPGAFDFREADAVADLAEQAHKDFQIHALIWDPLDQPQWNIVPPAIRAMLPDQRHQFMLDSVTTIMQRYAGLASTVTVVNEAFDQMGPVARSTFSTHFGPPALPTRRPGCTTTNTPRRPSATSPTPSTTS